MANLLKLPRLIWGRQIVDNLGKPTRDFTRYWDELLQKIESFVSDLAAVVQTQGEQQAMLEQIVITQGQQLVLINEALELAGIAVQLAGGNAGSASGTFSINDAGWTEGPQVDLPGVVAGDLTIPGTGLQIISGTTQNDQGDTTGQLRIVEIDGVTETVVGGPWAFGTTRYSPNPADPPESISNPAQIPGFSAALTTTGALSYRLDAQMDAGFAINNIRFYIFARRST